MYTIVERSSNGNQKVSTDGRILEKKKKVDHEMERNAIDSFPQEDEDKAQFHINTTPALVSKNDSARVKNSDAELKELSKANAAKEEKLKKLKKKNDELTESYLVISKKYDVLKSHFDNVTKSRLEVMEQLKSEAQRADAQCSKLQALETQLKELETQKADLEKFFFFFF
ncbi:hypothetical protein RFI_00231 [Reticulomyxa filosa]|uniref:Viral A-type inclusion protein n=1 Tax=Reticulomyxa filosa TaxID=46433 RepID=X6PGL6_RETFI|nr:hypothetical protein RFI_00231 [Reticulomyxa filosa]|eukprot:ETO36832.1 hypothetical protein RFI_00231 [Reticulomyxa filosa]